MSLIQQYFLFCFKNINGLYYKFMIIDDDSDKDQIVSPDLSDTLLTCCLFLFIFCSSLVVGRKFHEKFRYVALFFIDRTEKHISEQHAHVLISCSLNISC